MKKLFCTLLTVCILLSFAGCKLPSYEDTNGEADFSLQTITEEDILRAAGSTKIMASKVSINDNTVCKAQTMSGVETLFSERLKNETLDLTVSCAITKGNARLVLILDDKIIHDFAINEENQHITLDNVTGKVCLRLAGEAAGYVITWNMQ
jgi:hypothetical protein